MRRFALLLLLLFAFALRLWALDAKGLAYDEAATALMARATPAAITDFHWRAAFEHPPFWQLIMHYWSLGFGQSEVALRLLSVFAGVGALPLVWQLARRLGLSTGAALAAVLLTATAPILVYYSQEARMYTLVAAFVLASVLLTQQLAITPTAGTVALYLLVNWSMLGLHYYSVLLIGAEGCFLLGWLIWQRLSMRHWLWHGVALSLTLAPLALWMAFAPGFRATATIVLSGSGGPQPTPLQFADALWRDLTFAAIRWGSTATGWGYLLLPLLVIGFVALVQPIPLSAFVHKQRGLLLLLVCLLPVVVSLLISRTLATRYLLYIMPPLLIVIAAGIGWVGQLHWSLGLTALMVALTPSAFALPHYFGPYQKSAYREMTAYLTTHRQPDEVLLLEGPRQHLLAKYYLPIEKTFLTAPVLVLPDYWPVNAPPVVPEEMDDYLRQALVDHPGVWLSLTAENEVDPGEFVPKFLTAIAFQRECYGWLDVRLCHFVSPQFVEPQVQSQPDVLFNGEMLLQATAVTLRPARLTEPAYLLATLSWLAQTKPTLDYRVTVRLLDASGAVVSQRDSFPIGPLLPPTTWNAGDEKPGYLALPLPAHLPEGPYTLATTLYEPATLNLVTYRTGQETAVITALPIATLVVSHTMTLQGVALLPTHKN